MCNPGQGYYQSQQDDDMTSEKNSELMPNIPSGIKSRFWACHCEPKTIIQWYGNTAICTSCGKTNAQKVSDAELERLIEIAIENRTRVIKTTFQNERQARIEWLLQMDVQMKYIQDIKKRLEITK